MNSLQSRRSFIEKLALAAASLGITCALGRSATADTNAGESPLLDARFDASLGEDYLAAYPDEAEISALAREIFGVDASEAEALSQAELQARLADSIRRDFAEGKVFKFRGWRLSRSECRFFAIQTLLRDG